VSSIRLLRGRTIWGVRAEVDDHDSYQVPVVSTSLRDAYAQCPPDDHLHTEPRWLDGIHPFDLALAKTEPFERLGDSELDVQTAGVDGIDIDETKPYLCRTDLRGLTRG
jgi:hypothetical protein